MAQQPMYPGMPNSPITELAEAIDDAQTTFTLVDASKLQPAPNLAVIGSGENAETVLYESVNGNTLEDVTRGFQGVAQSWQAGQKVARNFTAYDWDSARENIEDHETRITDVEDGLDNLAGPGRTNQTVKGNADNLTSHINNVSEHTNGWRTYNSLSELGIAEGSETIVDICAAMTNRSELKMPKYTSNTSTAYPANAGMLHITKHTQNRTELRFFNGSNSGVANEWIGYYDTNVTPNFTGWISNAKKSDIPAYEEGVWTPELRIGGQTSGIVYIDQLGRYTRIGNMVNWAVDIILTSKGSAETGNVTLSGLPFAASSIRPSISSVVGFANVTLPSDVTGVTFTTFGNATSFTIRYIGNSLNLSQNMSSADLSNTSAFRAEGTYFI